MLELCDTIKSISQLHPFSLLDFSHGIVTALMLRNEAEPRCRLNAYISFGIMALGGSSFVAIVFANQVPSLIGDFWCLFTYGMAFYIVFSSPFDWGYKTISKHSWLRFMFNLFDAWCWAESIVREGCEVEGNMSIGLRIFAGIMSGIGGMLMYHLFWIHRSEWKREDMDKFFDSDDFKMTLVSSFLYVILVHWLCLVPSDSGHCLIVFILTYSQIADDFGYKNYGSIIFDYLLGPEFLWKLRWKKRN